MFTLAEINAAKPPNSPISTGAYWQSILYAAERKVKDITRRELESASYSDVGHTTPVENDDGSIAYAWYLREPTGTALAFSALTRFTLDDSTVATADVTIEKARLIFGGDGEVKVTYAGGYMRDTATGGAQDVLLGAVIITMHAIHKADQVGTAPDYSLAADVLAPYTAGQFTGGGYAEVPE